MRGKLPLLAMGISSSVRIYNTLTQVKEPLVARSGDRIAFYLCGPTTYDMAHVGHVRAVLVYDVLVRYLRAKGVPLLFIRNVTDVDDKIIARAAKTGEEPQALAARYADEFARDMGAVGILPPDVEPRVTGHMSEIVRTIEEIIARGFAYESSGSVYFSVRKFPGYGKLSRRNLDDLLCGARVEVDERKNDPLDFALWKCAKPGEPQWPSPWGGGRPGWHIECTAMSLRYAPAGLDLHAGGMDLIFPHHENEIAQSEAVLGTTFSTIWMHHQFVNIDKQKMSKSLGNFFTVRDVLEKAEPEALRYHYLGTHYRSPISFDVRLDEAGQVVGFPALEDAEARVLYCYETLGRASAVAGASPPDPDALPDVPAIRGFRARFDASMDDDVNTAQCLAALADMLRVTNDLAHDAGGLAEPARRAALAFALGEVRHAASVLGVLERSPAEFLAAREARAVSRRGLDEDWIGGQIAARVEARKRRDFAEADRIRDALRTAGVEIMDGAGGTTWKVAT